MKNKIKTLVYGFGNPGRQDDGIGNVMILRLESWLKDNYIMDVDLESNYQLNIEDAEKISSYQRVIFVDASKEEIKTCKLEKLNPAQKTIEFTMHAVSPSYLLYLCDKLFGEKPESYLLSIKGLSYHITEGLSKEASMNLDKAELFLRSVLRDSIFKKDICHKLGV
ncbi:MAG: hydrogenase maturation protease [Bacteroidota bacterium]